MVVAMAAKATTKEMEQTKHAHFVTNKQSTSYPWMT
jgi:hypothetical protein